MSIQRAEQLKRDWTDKHVMVQQGIPELRRFDKLVGQVRTVNMNCRLLIEFDTPADISWYDIDPQFVVVVDKQSLETEQKAKAEKAPDPKPASARPAAAAKASAGGRPLDKIRQSAAGGGTAAAAVSPLDRIRAQSSGATTGPTGQAADKKPATVGGSPLDQIRAQATVPSKVSDESASGSAAQPAPVAKAADSGTGSPLDRIRAQAGGAKKSGAVSAPAAKKPPTPAVSAPPSAGPASDTSGSGQSAGAAAEVVETAAAGRQPDHTIAPLMAAGAATAGGDSEPAKPAVAATTVAGDVQTPFDQVRRQAAESEDRSESKAAAATPIFDQIRQQATADNGDKSEQLPLSAGSIDPPKPAASPTAAVAQAKTDAAVAGEENPVNATFRGKKLPKKDDLKIVEGIGPKIAELFQADGISTWEQLSKADPERLKEILSAAGPRYRIHNPETWPAQAKLASEGQWQELETYQDVLDGGRPPESS